MNIFKSVSENPNPSLISMNIVKNRIIKNEVIIKIIF